MHLQFLLPAPTNRDPPKSQLRFLLLVPEGGLAPFFRLSSRVREAGRRAEEEERGERERIGVDTRRFKTGSEKNVKI